MWLDTAYRGKGMFRHMQTLMIKAALDWRAKRIEWRVEDRNERVLSLLESVGATKEGVLRNYLRHADGTWVNIAIFSMMRPEAEAYVRMFEDDEGPLPKRAAT